MFWLGNECLLRQFKTIILPLALMLSLPYSFQDCLCNIHQLLSELLEVEVQGQMYAVSDWLSQLGSSLKWLPAHTVIGLFQLAFLLATTDNIQ